MREVATAVAEAGLTWLVYVQQRKRFTTLDLDEFQASHHLALVLDSESEHWFLAHFRDGLPEGSEHLVDDDAEVWSLHGAGPSLAKKEVIRVLAAAAAGQARGGRRLRGC